MHNPGTPLLLLSNLKEEQLRSLNLCVSCSGRTPIKNIAVYYQFRQYKKKASRLRFKKETVIFASRESRTFTARWSRVQNRKNRAIFAGNRLPSCDVKDLAMIPSPRPQRLLAVNSHTVKISCVLVRW